MKSRDGLLELRKEELRLVLDPQRGGVLREFCWRERPILRSTPADIGSDPFDTACFAMAPYVNRVAHGRFQFGGRTVRLERNWSADPHPLHGQAWRAPWSVVDTDDARARLRFDGGGDDWPWRYRCELRIGLDQDALDLSLSIENLSDTPMPTMLGLHPYFADAGHATLQARLPRVWLADADALPIEEVSTRPEWRFDNARAVAAVALDHCFSDWDGFATLRWPDRVVTVTSAQCRYLHIFTPAQRDFFCIEPQSARTGALGSDTAGTTIVSAGERFEIRVRLDVRSS